MRGYAGAATIDCCSLPNFCVMPGYAGASSINCVSRGKEFMYVCLVFYFA